MRILITGTVAILIIPGLVKMVQDYEMTGDTSRQLSDSRDDDKIVHLNNFRNLHTKGSNSSDFF